MISYFHEGHEGEGIKPSYKHDSGFLRGSGLTIMALNETPWLAFSSMGVSR